MGGGGFAEEGESGGSDALGDVIVLVSDAVFGVFDAVGTGHSGDGIEVFDGSGDAIEGGKGLEVREGFGFFAGVIEGGFGSDVEECPEGGVVGFDAIEGQLGEFEGGDDFFADEAGLFEG